MWLWSEWMMSLLEWLIHQMLNYAEKLQFSLGCLARDSFDLSAIEVVWVFWDPPVPAQQAQLQVACANLRDVKVVGYRLLRLEQGCPSGTG